MANYLPFQGGYGTQDATNAPAGGYLLPPEQGEILVNGILVETGAIQLAGDARSTSARRTNFPIWLGQPNAGFVGEGASKPLTGAAFSQATIDIKKVATIVVFTDEMIEDLMNGDLNVLVDAGVRQAISRVIDQAAVGVAGTASTQPFGSLGSSVSTYAGYSLIGNSAAVTPVTLGAGESINSFLVNDSLQKAVSAAMGQLEANGYGNPDDMGVLLGFGFQQQLRDTRDAFGRPMYDGGSFGGQAIDALYGLDRAHSTNLVNASTTPIAVTLGGATGTATVSTANAALLYPGAPVLTSASNLTPTGQIVTGANTGTGVLTFTGGGALTTTNLIAQPKAVVVHKPNLHVRVRSDVSVTTSNEATLTSTTVADPSGDTNNLSAPVSLFQNNLTAVRYECRLGFLIHDPARSVVPIWG